ncbi:hypothetical protein D3C71_2054440 [compost metagenome]
MFEQAEGVPHRRGEIDRPQLRVRPPGKAADMTDLVCHASRQPLHLVEVVDGLLALAAAD